MLGVHLLSVFPYKIDQSGYFFFGFILLRQEQWINWTDKLIVNSEATFGHFLPGLNVLPPAPEAGWSWCSLCTGEKACQTHVSVAEQLTANLSSLENEQARTVPSWSWAIKSKLTLMSQGVIREKVRLRPHKKVEKQCNIIVILSEGITWNGGTDQTFVKMNSKNGFAPLTGKNCPRDATLYFFYCTFVIPISVMTGRYP